MSSTPSERVLALLYRYEFLDCREQYSKKEVIEALLWAANVAAEDGEQHLAPAWLQALRQQKAMYDYEAQAAGIPPEAGPAVGEVRHSAQEE
jgi:hypothetical protein